VKGNGGNLAEANKDINSKVPEEILNCTFLKQHGAKKNSSRPLERFAKVRTYVRVCVCACVRVCV